MNNTNKPNTNYVNRYKNYKNLGAGCPFFLLQEKNYKKLVGGCSLASDTIRPLNLESIENTAIQQNICLYTFAQCWKTKLRKKKLQSYLYIVPKV